MKLAKALELLPEVEASLRGHRRPDFADAVKLGIEALKRVKIGRGQAYEPYIDSLPGEDPPADSNRSLHHIEKVLESPLGKEPKVN